MGDVTAAAARLVDKAVSKVMSKINTMVRRVRVDAVDTTAARTVVKISASDLDDYDQVELVQPHGIASNPPLGSRGILLCPGGDAAHSLVIAAGSASTRLTGLTSGEVALYTNGTTGPRIILRASGDIDVFPAAGRQVRIGPEAAPKLAVARQTDPVAITAPALLTLQQAFDTWIPVPNDGGAALKTALATFLELDEGVVVQGTGTITGGGAGATSS